MSIEDHMRRFNLRGTHPCVDSNRKSLHSSRARKLMDRKANMKNSVGKAVSNHLVVVDELQHSSRYSISKLNWQLLLSIYKTIRIQLLD